MHTVTIYHNPKCGTSRNTLALIRNSGIEPKVIEYLLNPPPRETLLSLLAQMNESPRHIIRAKEPLYDELGLDNAELSDDTLLDAIATHPLLLNRPIVVTERGTKLCRPSELVLDILPAPQHGEFAKEDGERVIDANGKRLL